VITRISLKRPVFITMLFITLCFLGIISFLNIPFELLPDISFPEFVIYTEYKGMLPEIVERDVTDKIEDVISGIPGVYEIKSFSSIGKSVIIVRFFKSVNSRFAFLSLKEKINKILDILPKNASIPAIEYRGPFTRPLISLWISCDEEYMRNVIENKLVSLKGVSDVEVYGYSEKEIVISFDPYNISKYSVSIQEIKNFLKDISISAPLGYIQEGKYIFPLRLESDIEIKNLKNIYIKPGVKLNDIVSIYEISNKKTECYFNDKKGFFVNIYKEQDANGLSVSNEVIKTLNNFKNISYEIINNDALYIKKRFNSLFVSLIMGGLLAFAVLFIFSFNFRIPIVLFISIPVSILSSFVLFYFFKLKINIVTLSGITIALGMLIDSSIVVLESIMFHQDIIKGTERVGLAVLTSILTNIAVFFPLLYIYGISGDFLKPLSVSIIFTLLCSLLVSFTLLPLLLSKLKTFDISGFSEKFVNIYEKILNFSYKNSKLIYSFGILFLLLPLFIFNFLKKEFLPYLPYNTIMTLELPYGTDLKETNTIAKNLREFLNQKGYDVFYITGDYDSKSLTHSGFAMFYVKEELSERVISEWKKSFENINVYVEKDNPFKFYFKTIGKINVYIPYTTLKERNLKKNLLNKYRPKEYFEITFPQDVDVYTLIPEPLMMGKFKINNEMLGEFLKNVLGAKVMDWSKAGDRYKVYIRSNNTSIEDVMNLSFNNVPIRLFFYVKKEKIPYVITHYNGDRVIEVSIPYGFNFKLPDFNFDYKIGGEIIEYERSLKSVIFSFIIAVALIYIILSAFYESFTMPLYILLSVPFALSGFIITLFITNTSLNIFSMIGLIILSGIVVNNVIILLDEAKRLKKENKENPAFHAGLRRIRPILMTTFTTVFGLLPLSVMPGAEAHIGRGLIGGIIFSLFLSLVFIPVLYDKMGS